MQIVATPQERMFDVQEKFGGSDGDGDKELCRAS